MANLTDFAYIDLGINSVLITIWIIFHSRRPNVQHGQRYAGLTIHGIKVKWIAALLIFMSLLIASLSLWLTASKTYELGQAEVPADVKSRKSVPRIKEKIPTGNDASFIDLLATVFCTANIFKSAGILLLVLLWHLTVSDNSIVGRRPRSVISTTRFKLWILLMIVGVALILLSFVIPGSVIPDLITPMVYCISLLVVAGVCKQLSGLFDRIIEEALPLAKRSCKSSDAPGCLLKHMEKSQWLAGACFFEAITFVIISVDSATREKGDYGGALWGNDSKLLKDTISVMYVIAWSISFVSSFSIAFPDDNVYTYQETNLSEKTDGNTLSQKYVVVL